MSNPWIQTFTGKRFDLLAPTAEMVDIHDIAHALARINRFTGHTRAPYSVAEHSIRVANAVGTHHPEPWVPLAALLHDAHEAYVGDIASPIAWALSAMTARLSSHGSAPVKDLKWRVDGAIGAKFFFDVPDARPFDHPAIKAADATLLLTEARDHLPGGPRPDWTTSGAALDAKLPEPMVAIEAERAFLICFSQLTGEEVDLSRCALGELEQLRHQVRVLTEACDDAAARASEWRSAAFGRSEADYAREARWALDHARRSVEQLDAANNALRVTYEKDLALALKERDEWRAKATKQPLNKVDAIKAMESIATDAVKNLRQPESLRLAALEVWVKERREVLGVGALDSYEKGELDAIGRVATILGLA